MAITAELRWFVVMLTCVCWLRMTSAQGDLRIEAIPSNLGVLAGQSVELNCTVLQSEDTVNITWGAVGVNGTPILLTNIVIFTEENVTTSSVCFSSISPEQAGIYNCTTTDGQSADSASFRLSVITVNGVNDVITSPGNTAMFFCNASGDPALSYLWMGEFSADTLSRISGINTASLSIFGVTLSDTRNNTEMVVCTISLFDKVVGTANGSFEVLRVILTESPASLTVTAGETAVLNCSAENTDDAPNPLTFEWRVNSSEPVVVDFNNRITITTTQGGNESTNMSTSSLTIRRTTFTDFGNYFCLVTNFGTADRVQSAVANLTIEFVPVITGLNVEVNGIFPPTANGQQFMADANVLTNVLVGSTIAEPPISSVQLFRVEEEGNVTVEPINCNITLPNQFRCSLPSLNVNESGVQFEVLAVNRLGNDTRTFELVVQDVPGPVDLSMVTSVVEDLLRVRLRWPMPVNNNAPITGYTIYFCHVPASGSCVPDRNVSTNDDSLTLSLEHGAGLNSNISISITAQNRVGMGAMDSESIEIPVATTADATPQDIVTSAATSQFMAVVWDLPSTALGVGIEVNYTVNLNFSRTSDSIVNRNTTNRRGIFLDSSFGIEPGLRFDVVVTARYIVPPDEEVTTLPVTFTVPQRADVPIFAQPVVVINNSPTTVFVSWRLPPNIEFLDGYSVNYSSTLLNQVTRRRKRATNPSGSKVVGPQIAVTNVPTCAFSTVTVSVDAVYNGNLRIPLVEPNTFQTPQSAPSAPRQLQVAAAGTRSLICTWRVPNPTNGIITNYLVSFYIFGQPAFQRRRETVRSIATTYTIINLDPFTKYVVSITGQTIADEGMPSSEVEMRTGFGVTRPRITILTTIINDVFSARFTVEREDGPISFYQVIVSRDQLDDTTTMLNIPAYSSTSRSIYVAAVGTLEDQQNSEAINIGGGMITQNGSVQYTNQNLSGNTNYYVFVRVFSSIDTTVFNDSALSQPFRYAPGLNVGAIIGSIAAVAAVLIAVLVVLLIFAYYTMASPSKRRSSHKRSQGSMELRRTRVFAPVLNVGNSDVFTSAGQPTTLICEASGTPAPSVSWTRDKEPLDKERFIQLADGSLFINDTDLQDEGTYVVKAVNSVGVEEVHVHLALIKPAPPDTDMEHPPIKVGEFSEKIALLRADDGLEEEYEDVEPDMNVTSYISKLNINKNKNRYINIIPYDHSRVVLSLQDSTPGSDYINASFIDAYQAPNGYLASQGPMPSTFPDFWRMLWEFDVPTIVMVTNLTEDDKVKCHQYWPSFGSKTYGNIQVTLKEVENLAEYSIRTFNVSPLAGQSRVQMPVREVRQFQFLVWPDHGVPAYATNLLSFRKRVLKYHPEKRGPMAVHCSAGVGRTGTFITIDYMLKQMEAEGIIDIFNFVRHMRYRRNYMVQTTSQYVFIYNSLLEAIMCGDNSIKAPELKKKVKELREVVPETGVSIFETQFKTLEAASPPDEDFDCSIAQLPENASKNRSESHLPANDFRMVLSTENNGSDYICASVVDNYRERNAFIVTQAPLEETVKDFWRMIWETKSAVIVMLTGLVEDGQELCVKYWPSAKEEPSVYGGYQVVLSEEKDKGDYITRRFKISQVDGPQESRMLSQFHFVRWSKTLPPKDCRPMIDLIDELQRVQRKSGNMPITVHCDDGIGRTGAFCTLYSVLERVKTEQVVDVFQAVKTLRIQRTGLMTTVSEYEFVHYAVIEFLETFSEYQNFK